MMMFQIMIIIGVILDLLCVFGIHLFQWGVLNTPMAHEAVFLLMTFKEAVVIYMVRQWILSEDFRLYQSRDHVRRHYGILSIPVIIMLALLVLNYYVPFIFSVEEDLTVAYKNGMIILRGAELVGFLYTIVETFRHEKGDLKAVLKRVWPVLGLLAISISLQICTGFETPILLPVLCVVFLIVMSLLQRRYEDKDSGFYNEVYYRRLLTNMKKGKETYRAFLIFEAEKSPDELARILREELPVQCGMIRLKRGRFVLPMEINDRGMIDNMCDLVRECASEYDEAHPEERISLKTDVLRADGLE